MSRLYHLLFSSVLIVPSLCIAEQLIDPTAPAGYQSKSATSTVKTVTTRLWILNSTIVSPSQKLAIINGKKLTIGEEINGATVKSINHKQVELVSKENIITLSLQQSFISEISTGSK